MMTAKSEKILSTAMRLILIALLVHFSVSKKLIKRQVSLDEIIQGALNFVRPIIDTSRPISTDLLLQKKPETTQNRDFHVLGAPKSSSLDDVPICKSNSRICKFIACSAHKFKADQSIANLNLAAQVLADPKLRRAISSNPDTLLEVCVQQGLSTSECKLFANAFQLIDKFISTIEPEDLPTKKSHRYPVKDYPYEDEFDAPPVMIYPSNNQLDDAAAAADEPVGSRTWSIRNRSSNNPFGRLPPAALPGLPLLGAPLLLAPQPFALPSISALPPSSSSSSSSSLTLLSSSPSTSASSGTLIHPILPTPAPFTFPPLLFTLPTFFPPLPFQPFIGLMPATTVQQPGPTLLPSLMLGSSSSVISPTETAEQMWSSTQIRTKRADDDYYDQVEAIKDDEQSDSNLASNNSNDNDKEGNNNDDHGFNPNNQKHRHQVSSTGIVNGDVKRNNRVGLDECIIYLQ